MSHEAAIRNQIQFPNHYLSKKIFALKSLLRVALQPKQTWAMLYVLQGRQDLQGSCRVCSKVRLKQKEKESSSAWQGPEVQ